MTVSKGQSQPQIAAAAFFILYLVLGRPFLYQVLIMTHLRLSVFGEPLRFSRPHPLHGSPNDSMCEESAKIEQATPPKEAAKPSPAMPPSPEPARTAAQAGAVAREGSRGPYQLPSKRVVWSGGLALRAGKPASFSLYKNYSFNSKSTLPMQTANEGIPDPMFLLGMCHVFFFLFRDTSAWPA